jgi:transketolase
VFFGVREHGMGAVMNGLALHGGVRPYGGTFLVFSDYMRPSIRLAAMMGLPVIYLFSHDSIGLGEDGPTHQPIETVTVLRAIPGLRVIRPADANETVQAWRVAVEHRSGPVALILTRQNLPVLDRDRLAPAEGLARGAYVLSEAGGGAPQAILLSSGSEIPIALEAQTALEGRGVPTRVVNMACHEIFAEQAETYRREVLPRAVRVRVAIEAGHPLSWQRWLGDSGDVVGIQRFGESAPFEDLYRVFGLTADDVVSRVLDLLQHT